MAKTPRKQPRPTPPAEDLLARVASLDDGYVRLRGQCPGEFNVQALSKTETLIELYDLIGPYGVSAKAFSDAIKQAKSGDITLRINSPGGSVFDGLAMYQDLKMHPGNVTIEIMALAASAASVVAMAGDEIRIAPSAMIMVHNAWVGLMGNASALREAADTLDKIDANLTNIYVERTGQRRADITKLLNAETWMTADEAIEQGFADETMDDEDEQAPSAWDLTSFHNAPATLSRKPAVVPKRQVATPTELEALLRSSGLSRVAARRVASGGWKALRGETSAVTELIAHVKRRAGNQQNERRV